MDKTFVRRHFSLQSKFLTVRGTQVKPKGRRSLNYGEDILFVFLFSQEESDF